MKIGLTGGIASGKSTAVNILQQLGAKIIDADQIAHQLMKPEKKLWAQIIDQFGQQILQSNKEIDRKKLGEIIFNNREKKEKLDQITHPIIIQEIEKQLEQLAQTNQIVIADIPLLIELDLMELFDEVWLVYVSQKIQLNRLIERDNININAARAKIESQMPLDKKVEYADRIIGNNDSIANLEKQIKQLWKEIKTD